MRRKLTLYGSALAVLIGAELMTSSRTVDAAQKYTQYANQCVNRKEYSAGYYSTPGTLAKSYAPYPFSRFYNTCGTTISLLLTTDGHGNNGPGAPGPGGFMVMGWPDGSPKDVHTFVCVYPGEPVKPGSTFVNLPSYQDSSYQCLVP